MNPTEHPPQHVAADLRWYFTREMTGPLRSNYGSLIHRLSMARAHRDREAHQDDDTMLEDAARAGGIARVLRAMDAAQADVLWRAYGAEWPEELALLGDLSAVAPLTQAAVNAHHASGTTLTLNEWLCELFRYASQPGELETLGCIHHDAQVLRSRAVGVYLSLRRRIGSRADQFSREGVLLGVRARSAGGDFSASH